MAHRNDKKSGRWPHGAALLRGWLARVILLGAIAFGIGVPASVGNAQPVELSMAEAMEIAEAQINTRPDLSASLMHAVLAQNGANIDALIILAAAEIARGNWNAALAAAKKAFNLAPPGPARVSAGRLAASALYKSERHTRAQWWLRRSLNNARQPATIAALRSEFATVTRANPFSAKVGFSLAPNSNINNGSNSETITIWNLPFLLSADARALSGFEASANAELSFRLSESNRHRTDLGLLVFGRTFELSAVSRAAAPNVKGSDYAFAGIEISLQHKFRFSDAWAPTSVGLTFGKNWYGGDPYTTYQRLDLGQDIVFQNGTVLQLSASRGRQISIPDGNLPSDTYSLGANVRRQLGNRDMLGFGLTVQDTKSPDASRENRATRAQITYQIARPIFGMSISANLSGELRDFDYSIYDINGRHDQNLTIGISAGFPKLSYFGFSPTATLEANRTNSNVSLYSRESIGLRMGIQSTF